MIDPNNPCINVSNDPCDIPCGDTYDVTNYNTGVNDQQLIYQQQLYAYYLYLTRTDPTYNYLLTNPNNMSFPYTNNCNQYINPYTNETINLPIELLNNCIYSPYNCIYTNMNKPNALSTITLELIFGGDLSGSELIKLDKSKENSEITKIPVKIGPFGVIVDKVRVNYAYTIRNGIPVWTIFGGEIDFSNLLTS